MSETSPTVVCAGHINWDVTMHVDRLPEPDGEVQIRNLVQSGGGSAANVSVGLAGLDASATIFGSVGGDDSGAFALRELDRSGVECGHVLIAKDRGTAVKYLVVDSEGEVMVFASDGANEAFTAADLPPSVLSTVDHLHLTSQEPETAVELAALVRDVGGTVSFDPGRRVAERAFKQAFPSVDVLFVNEREAEATADDYRADGPEDGLLVIKGGAAGAELRAADVTVEHPGYAIDPVDTTGAGDAFAAGFISAWLETPMYTTLFESTPEAETFVTDDEATTENSGAGTATSAGNTSDSLSPDGSLPQSADTRDTGVDLPDNRFERLLAIANACGALAAQDVTARTSLTWDRVARLIESESESE